jgi:crotonobetainyl-CoA:carnitine CoA-transferase CaiB-like acyl-CoA transferase
MTTPPLSDLVVVDLSTGIPGAYCTKLLADGGAPVVKVEAPEGDPLRRWSASGTPVAEGSDGPLFTFLASSKQAVVADPDVEADLARVRELVAGADVVVWSPESRLAAHPALSPEALRQAGPRATVTTITPFGLEGPWAGRPATELTLQAWSGAAIGLGRGAADRPPVSVGGQIGHWMTGTYAAIGTLVSRARDDGEGELVDVSILETLALSLTYYPVTYHDLVGRPFRRGRALVVPGVESTSDGVVGLGVGTGQQWLDFCAMVEHPEWTEDRKLFADRGHLKPDIADWVGQRTSAEVLELAGLFRIPHAPIGNGASIPRTDHFQARGSLVEDPRDGFLEPDRPYRFDPPLLASPTPAPRLGETPLLASSGDAGGRRVTPDAGGAVLASSADAGGRRVTPDAGGGLPFAGLRVLDLTAFWAGPLCSEVLALLGAEVLHVESTARPDGTRLLAGLRFSEAGWWERSGIFAGLNAGKKSITLDLGGGPGRDLLRRLIATCDVIVENFTPRVLDQLGFDADAVRAIRPDIVMVRMPGFGLDGPWRDDPAFAFVIEDAAGLTWLTGHPDENPVSPYCVGDSNAGLHALTGLLLALRHRRRTGEGVVVEAAMVDAALNVGAEQLVEHSANGAVLHRDGNRGPTAAPQNLYLAADVDPTDATGRRDTWVAISVSTDEQWQALRTALGDPAWAADPALDDGDGRRARHDDLDRQLAAWCAARPADEVVDALWPAGVPVARVVQPHEQGDNPQLRARGWFEDVVHPVAGPARHPGLPIRFSRGPERFHGRPAPMLGEHTEEVLRGIGVTDEELAELRDAKVIGRVPDAYRPAT